MCVRRGFSGAFPEAVVWKLNDGLRQPLDIPVREGGTLGRRATDLTCYVVGSSYARLHADTCTWSLMYLSCISLSGCIVLVLVYVRCLSSCSYASVCAWTYSSAISCVTHGKLSGRFLLIGAYY
eukprot:54255-Eustigmatos_ZCMA.PRE.1